MRTSSTRRRLAATLGAVTLVAALGAPAAAVATGADCEPLVTHRPTGSDGDTAAVAITSQALAAGVAGWEHAGWEADEHTTVTAVTVVREDGSEHRTAGDLRTGSAEDVLELRFCGTRGTGDRAEGPRQPSVLRTLSPEPGADEEAEPPTSDEEAGAMPTAPEGDAAAPLGALLGALLGVIALAGAWALRRRREVRR